MKSWHTADQKEHYKWFNFSTVYFGAYFAFLLLRFKEISLTKNDYGFKRAGWNLHKKSGLSYGLNLKKDNLYNTALTTRTNYCKFATKQKLRNI